jgi:transcriptional regulator NrdR family protein
MGGKNGGTQMYCPQCKEITICSAITPKIISGQSGQRFFKPDHDDVKWFRRGRACSKCHKEFLTAEVNEDFLDELVELRDALDQIKEKAATFNTEIKSTQKSLKNLSTSLGLLKALKR